MTRTIRFIALSVCFAGVAYAEPQSSQPVAKPDGLLRYQVVQIEGKVRVGPDTDTSLNTNGPGWLTPKAGDLLGPGIQIRVPVRGRLKLSATPSDPPTVVLIESMSNISISELAYKNGVATSRVKLGYGAIRAGVVEGATRSDMEIEAPTATLSKKGTDIFRMEYHDNRFIMSLTDQGRGALQAMQFQSGRFGVPRSVTAGQFVTHNLVRAIENVQFDRTININDQFGLVGNDKLFTLLNDRGGFAFLIPGGGQGNELINGQSDKQNNGLESPDQNTNNTLSPAGRRTATIVGGAFGIGQGNLTSLQAARTQFSTRIQKAGATGNPLSSGGPRR